MLEEEAQHLPRRVGPARIGVGAGGTAARPGVASTVNIPMLGDGTPARIGKVRAGVGVPMGHSSIDHLLSNLQPWRTARQSGRRCSDSPWCRDRHGKRWSALTVHHPQF
jgi:hypothetical protein